MRTMMAMMARGPRAGHALAAAVLATGCFSIPPFEPESGVSFTESGTGGGTTSGTGFALRFADGPGFHFPDALLIDGVDVMGHDASQTCFNEDEIGFRIVPTARISATGDAPAVKNLLVPALRGPAVVQTRLEWATQFKCNGMRAPGGTSTYTMFPDGRIVRFDTLADVVATEIVPTGCECEPPTQSVDQLFTISTHWTLARDRFTTLSYDSNMEDLPDDGEELAANHATSCIAHESYQVAFAWPLAMVMAPMPLQTSVRGRPSLIELRRDLVRGEPRLEAFSHENSSAIFIDRRGCGEAFKRANEHAEPSSLTINKGAPIKPSPRDGIYGGDPGAGGLAGIDVPDGSTTLEGAVNSSFAVWLRFPGAVDAVRATLAGKTGPWYLPQQVDDRTWIVWFKDPIANGQAIVVEPR